MNEEKSTTPKIEYPDLSQKPESRNFDVMGFFPTTSTVPTHIPTNWSDQVQIYVNGSTYRLYWYDNTGHVWHYVSATV